MKTTRIFAILLIMSLIASMFAGCAASAPATPEAQSEPIAVQEPAVTQPVPVTEPAPATEPPVKPEEAPATEPEEEPVEVPEIGSEVTEEIPDESMPLASAPEDSASDASDEETVPAPVFTFEGVPTKRDAEAIAVYHAGLDLVRVSFLFCKPTYENGTNVFKVTFREGDYAYEVIVHAGNGEVLRFDKEFIS